MEPPRLWDGHTGAKPPSRARPGGGAILATLGKGDEVRASVVSHRPAGQFCLLAHAEPSIQGQALRKSAFTQGAKSPQAASWRPQPQTRGGADPRSREVLSCSLLVMHNHYLQNRSLSNGHTGQLVLCRGDFAPRGHGARSGDIFDWYSRGGVLWAPGGVQATEAMEAVQYLRAHGAAPSQRISRMSAVPRLRTRDERWALGRPCPFQPADPLAWRGSGAQTGCLSICAAAALGLPHPTRGENAAAPVSGKYLGPGRPGRPGVEAGTDGHGGGISHLTLEDSLEQPFLWRFRRVTSVQVR